MAKNKYYAVKRGKVQGVFESWDECKKNIDGFSGAEYKSFSTQEEAEAYINGIDLTEKHLQQATSTDSLIAYVDGSYDDSLKKYSFGCVIITPQGSIIEESGYNDNPEAIESRNVAGELQGVMFVVGWAYEKGFNKVIIRHDYEGVAKWATGEWKAKSYCAMKYVEYLQKFSNEIEMSFEKVTAHSGDKYNEIADNLAKKAIKEGVKSKTKLNSGNSYFTVEGVEISEIEAIINIIGEELEGLTIDKKVETDKTSFIVSKEKEKTFIIHYKSNKTVVQGKPLKLFKLFVSYITELLDIEEITPVLNDYYDIEIKKDQIDIQILEYLPNVSSFHSEKFKASLYQAIYNLNLRGAMYDYSYLLYPALRALEGHIRYIMVKYKVPIKGNFDMFEPHENNGYRLKKDYNSNFGSPNKISYVNRAYCFYRKYRNRLFHWDTPIGCVDPTVMISSKAEADKIIKETLSLVNEYYTLK